MTDIDVAALRAAAEAATPGPWFAEGEQVAQGFDDGMTVGGVVHASWEGYGEADAAYIAGANPEVMLALLDRLAAAEAMVDRARALVDQMFDALPRRRDDAAHGRLEVLRAMTAALIISDAAPTAQAGTEGRAEGL